MSAEAIGMNAGGELTPSVAIGLRGRHTSPFGLAVESLPMAKAATQPATRNSKLTQAQLEARAQQRIEDDELGAGLDAQPTLKKGCNGGGSGAP